jgi:hypothetical protein
MEEVWLAGEVWRSGGESEVRCGESERAAGRESEAERVDGASRGALGRVGSIRRVRTPYMYHYRSNKQGDCTLALNLLV